LHCRIYLVLSLEKVHLMGMFEILKKSGSRLVGRWAAAAMLLTASGSLSATAQTAEKTSADHYYESLPQETSAAGVKLMLRRLQTTGRLLQVDAHPDDEDGGMLTLESRGKGATVTLLTLTRGEGGQNKTGGNLFDELGVLRTLEVLAADRYYGIDQRFSRVADFGYSKNSEETFQKWQGHDIALADIVRVIREFRPDVLVARFSGTELDGHGHHQASAILTKEAFRVAADPNRFPEQIKEGLLPWQPKKLYIGNVCSFGAQTCPDKDYTLKLNTGEVDPMLGESDVQLAVEGLRHQQSQGLSEISLPSGPRYSFYRLVDSVLPPTTNKDGHEKDFFDGIDTSLPGLAARLGDEEKKVPWLRPALEKIADDFKVAAEESEGRAQIAQSTSFMRFRSVADPLTAALKSLSPLLSPSGEIAKSSLSDSAKAELQEQLTNKYEQAARAINLALNVTLQATVLAPRGSTTGFPREADALTLVSPGQKFGVQVKLHNGSKYPLHVRRIALDVLSSDETPEKLFDQKKDAAQIDPGQDYQTELQLQVPANALDTRPYWHRDNPEEDAIDKLDQPRYATLPFTPLSFHASVEYTRDAGVLSGVQVPASCEVLTPFLDAKGVEQKRTLAVAPPFSVMLEPGEQVIPVENGAASNVKVQVGSNLDGTPQGKLHLEAPEGWRVEPPELAVGLHHRGETKDYQFKVFPASLKEGRAQIRAVLDAGGTKYSEGYSLVTREDLGSFYYYQPAVQRVSIVDVKVPKGLKVGYIMGAGDGIPAVLQQVGINVMLIPADRLGSEDFSQYQTIVLGIRAYDTQNNVIANNKRLLDFVRAGGRLVVQYNAATADFNAGKFTPYPATLSRARVSVEEAPIVILDPANPIFHSPNEITQKDFDGWVQERGLYFMSQWDSNFTPLLESHDPGEGEQKGGLLIAHYGKGTYIYTGYAFFRQLPAGVPGAARLFVNLIAGH
jgi:LmbE family N-acetylglucosaminyl deacetylase